MNQSATLAGRIFLNPLKMHEAKPEKSADNALLPQVRKTKDDGTTMGRLHGNPLTRKRQVGAVCSGSQVPSEDAVAHVPEQGQLP